MKTKQTKEKVKKPTLKDLLIEARKLGMEVHLSLEPKITIVISTRMESDLQKLVATGLFGVNVQEAARRLLEEELRQKQWLINNPALKGLR